MSIGHVAVTVLRFLDCGVSFSAIFLLDILHTAASEVLESRYLQSLYYVHPIQLHGKTSRKASGSGGDGLQNWPTECGR